MRLITIPRVTLAGLESAVRDASPPPGEGFTPRLRSLYSASAGSPLLARAFVEIHPLFPCAVTGCDWAIGHAGDHAEGP